MSSVKISIEDEQGEKFVDAETSLAALMACVQEWAETAEALLSHRSSRPRVAK
ncbi:hypothetical protein JZ751_007367 [Albula glossodonta]|uniref:Uncharacterized protein n=1 Tax=Albula glossodonta TaxID=121402 RepID=A0A8T2N5G7_9TELE|nr:hypothetical protein JZ751_007367 [Albula glossodonta]